MAAPAPASTLPATGTGVGDPISAGFLTALEQRTSTSEAETAVAEVGGRACKCFFVNSRAVATASRNSRAVPTASRNTRAVTTAIAVGANTVSALPRCIL